MQGSDCVLQHFPFSDLPLQHKVVGVTVVPLLEQQPKPLQPSPQH
jgi:hypothetical protein